MSKQGWVETYITAQVDGPTLTTSTTNTSILPPAAKWNMPTGWFDGAGKTLKLLAKGRATANATAPGTLLFNVTVAGTIIFTTGAINLNPSATQNSSFVLDIDITDRAIGNSTVGNTMTIGTFTSAVVNNAPAGAAAVWPVPAAAPTTGATFDTTVGGVVDLQAGFSVSASNNNITIHQYMLQGVN